MEIKDLIMEDIERGIFRYHRSALTSPDILELERERIFNKCWIYLGHESEVEKPGDFRRRTVVGRPCICNSSVALGCKSTPTLRPAQIEYEGKSYHFCSNDCHAKFMAGLTR